jgi:hypothetical protein
MGSHAGSSAIGDSRPSRTNESAEFTARGGPTASAPALLVRRVSHEGAVERLADHVSADDELAVSYVNPSGWAYLLVYAVDEHDHVYWYYPAWTDPNDNPKAIAIAAGPDPYDLPDAVRHRFAGSSVRLVGVFTNQRLSVRQVEDELNPSSNSVPRPGPRFTWQVALRVEKPK